MAHQLHIKVLTQTMKPFKSSPRFQLSAKAGGY